MGGMLIVLGILVYEQLEPPGKLPCQPNNQLGERNLAE